MASKGDTIKVNDSMQKDYSYKLEAGTGRLSHDGFKPHFTPKEMLELGVFEGKYLNDCQDEFPKSWFENAKLSDKPDPDLNYFGIKSRQPLSRWIEKGWIIEPDPRGWFQWYCRYYLGRRIEGVDDKQVQRWKSFARHQGQVKKNCDANDLSCRPKQRQALLQWSYDCMI
ncbi:hypothetical protein MLD63_06160 [Paracoccus sp. TK19116]|uniref:Uncharacterized protein n=1 Tax=Paracoccus albicereus TaxID=2922394 RepID=A0ABT1MRN8_9RHOB|nr:hypothetical protein [Paracoccus albicereus]MCQ0970008.1 hypothetical protein [Paracoccus albicereus]